MQKIANVQRRCLLVFVVSPTILLDTWISFIGICTVSVPGTGTGRYQYQVQVPGWSVVVGSFVALTRVGDRKVILGFTAR